MLFYDAAIDDLKNNPGELTEATIRTYQWNLRKIRDFMPEMECNSIDEKMIRDFKIHLQEKGNKPATVTKALSVFRIFVNRLRKEGLIENDPFVGVKIGRVYTRRGFLTMRELKQL
ncbi:MULTISPECIES: phage integrase SAM-like domain-containing protein [unclassified Fibrobacter]|uniref:phage integrase SAM-like domain-containing protein n=1 Tax=unclassified Fibrobacter TaxID=2634177 RepID=UPI000D6D455B|nr:MULTISPECIES: phage integrase SAM-like domain-containing protein [unclassified Fibrobacter]PWJ62788.1 integrase-like protein [Fibrobacter sp. UWR4]PZW63721.1 integrase-like protein [Fibrobacter sp. UWR1]